MISAEPTGNPASGKFVFQLFNLELPLVVRMLVIWWQAYAQTVALIPDHLHRKPSVSIRPFNDRRNAQPCCHFERSNRSQRPGMNDRKADEQRERRQHSSVDRARR